ncbi:class I SAM-dependent methyltransferase [Amycolatopsis japonica]|uniref:class I SAM-dependent methyltransferase n=1 Tax=Amycolatopsis japonica TaxID=208439 RepID=UPI0037AC668D
MSGTDVARLVLVAEGRDEEIASVIDSVGAARVVEILVDEISCRFDWPQVSPAETVVVGFCFKHKAEDVVQVITAGTSGVAPADRTMEPHAQVEQELTEAVRAVFGPPGAPKTSTRRVQLRGSDSKAAFIQPPPAFYVVQRITSTMDARDAVDLNELATRYRADKWGIHFYTQHYQRHFEPLRHRPLTILEIGVGGLGLEDPSMGGASLRMWKRYFPRALVYGVDIEDKAPVAEQRIGILRADQSNHSALAKVVDATGPLDVIIDDGSHVNEHVLTSFRTLFPYLRDGGIYVIEDLQTAYWPRFGGTSDAPDDGLTSVGFLKSLIDALNYEEILESGSRQSTPYDGAIRGLHFYHNIVFIEKGLNVEGGGPDWVRYGQR